MSKLVLGTIPFIIYIFVLQIDDSSIIEMDVVDDASDYEMNFNDAPQVGQGKSLETSIVLALCSDNKFAVNGKDMLNR